MKKSNVDISDAELEDLFKLFSNDTHEEKLINYS